MFSHDDVWWQRALADLAMNEMICGWMSTIQGGKMISIRTSGLIPPHLTGSVTKCVVAPPSSYRLATTANS